MSNARSVLVLGSFAPSLVLFRGRLLEAMVGRGHRVLAVAPGADESVRRSLSAIGVTYVDVPLGRASIDPLGDLRTLRRLVALFRARRPDALLCYTIKPVVYGMIAARLTGIRHRHALVTGLGYAFTPGDGIARRAVRAAAAALYRVALGCSEKVFFQNPDDRADFLRLGLLASVEKSVLVNGSGVDLDAFIPAPPPSKPVFLMIARLLGDKGVREYVQAARVIRQRPAAAGEAAPPPCRLVGWIDDTLDAIQARELDAWVAAGDVDHLGRLDDVRPAIAASSVYVLPSYREGTPRTVLEAMAMGRPVITTDVPGCRETVVDGVNGFLVPARDANALAEAMLRFVAEPGLIARMGAESRRIAEEKYDVHKVNDVILRAMGL